MARGKFKAPEPAVPEVDVPEGRPPFIEEARYLVEKATGIIHPYTEAIAARGDLVEAYNGALPKTGRLEPTQPPPPRRAARAATAPVIAPQEQSVETGVFAE